MNKPVVIIGSGFSGSSTAFHLASLGIKTLVLERNDSLGGYFPTLEMQFPTNSCGVCFMNPDYPSFCPYIELQRDENIECVTGANIIQIKQMDSDYKVIYENKDGVFEISAQAVVLSTGYDTFDVKDKPELGGGIYNEVLPALEMEKLIYRLRAGERVDYKKIAYIQCVGSRDLRINKPYCSSFCCMFAIKQAMLLKELSPEFDITIFYMDIRAFGKDYERYYRKAKEMGIRFVRSAVANVKKRPSTGKMEVLYTKDGSAIEESFDLVVLSQGADFKNTAEKIIKNLGVSFDYHRETFLSNREVLPNFFVTGSVFEPMDIPDSVLDGAYIASLLSERFEFDIKSGTPKKVKFQKAKNVAIACLNIEDEIYSSLKENFEKIANLKSFDELAFFVNENNIDGLCLICDDVRIYEAKLREKENFGIHTDSLYLISSKSTNLIDEINSAVFRIKSVNRQNYHFREINKKVAVIGGGVAGMVSAIRFSRIGLPVVLIEKDNELGGRLKNLPSKKELIDELINTITKEAKIELLKGFSPVSLDGRFGDFRLTIESETEKRKIDCGTIVIAVGGESREKLFSFEDGNRVITQHSFENRINDICNSKTVVMLQCAGSRTDENPVCYRVCCIKSVENAIKIKETNPETDVFILHKDIRTYGYKENLYRKARYLGVNFIRFENNPDITVSENSIKVNLIEEGTGKSFNLNADYIILSTGINPKTDDISKILNLETQDGFIIPYNKKSAITDIKPGVYAVGLCVNPLYTDDIIKQASATALRTAIKIFKKQSLKKFNSAFVNYKYCCGCELCVKACPVSARYISKEEKIAVVDEMLCEGCGTCAMVCTNKASQHKLYEHKSMLKTIDYYL